MAEKILILGYYHRQNIGDDVFAFVFKQFFKTYWPKMEIIIKNTDDLTKIPDGVTAIICGGGDLVNDYFIPKIKQLTQTVTCPVYAIGIGIPYPKLIDQDYLEPFDFIIHRNQSDAPKLLEKYGPSRVKHCPDLAFYLPQMTTKKQSNYLGVLNRLSHRFSKKIGVCLARPIYRPSDPEAYEQILNTMADFISQLAKQRKTYKLTCRCTSIDVYKYVFYLIPCCTRDGTEKEDDRKLNADLYRKIQQRGNYPNIRLINEAMPIDEIIPIFKSFHLTICTRFHAHVFSFLAETPVISVSCSRKVMNLMSETNLDELVVKMPVNPTYLYPLSLDGQKLYETFNLVTQHYDIYKQQFKVFRKNYLNQLPQLTTLINNLICYKIHHFDPENSYFNHLVREKLTETANFLVKCLYPNANDEDHVAYVEKLVNSEKQLYDLLVETGFPNTPKNRNLLSEAVSFSLIRNRHSKYNWGLGEQIFTPEYKLTESVHYILSQEALDWDHQKLLTNTLPVNYRKFNLDFFHQHSLAGYHRSGWNYAVQCLYQFHHPDGIIFDSYLDRTFGWQKDFFYKIGVLPFKQKWVGVFHHTPTIEYSSNNLTTVFESELFIDSLETCKGIIVLSNYLKRWIMSKLRQMNKSRIPVTVLYHPTEMVEKVFCIESFTHNCDKKVIQIGAWLRDSYAIYRLPQPQKFRKCALQGKEMENYFPKPEYINNILCCLLKIGCGSEFCLPLSHDHCHEICRPGIYCNKYIAGLIEMIKENHNSVTILDTVSNEEFDDLLSKNVVFINLVDASAVNTIIECIVRNTPILVNRLPAVEEYLGRGYPLYYDNYTEAVKLLDDFSAIYKAHVYLKQMDKCRFNLYNFSHALIKSRLFNKLDK